MPKLQLTSSNGPFECEQDPPTSRCTEHCFSYDSDKSGAIDKKEMTRVMKSVYAMLGTKGSEKSSLDEKVAIYL